MGLSSAQITCSVELSTRFSICVQWTQMHVMAVFTLRHYTPKAYSIGYYFHRTLGVFIRTNNKPLKTYEQEFAVFQIPEQNRCVFANMCNLFIEAESVRLFRFQTFDCCDTLINTCMIECNQLNESSDICLIRSRLTFEWLPWINLEIRAVIMF